MFSICSHAEADRVISCLTLGFSADPVVRWFYPEQDCFLTNFPRVAELFGGGAFKHGSAYRNNDFAAIALWLPAGVHPDEEGLVSHFEKTVAPDKLNRLFSLFEQMGVITQTSRVGI